MKKILTSLLTAALLITLTSCGANTSEGKSDDKPDSPPDLSGQWKQANRESEENYQGAIINGDTIEIYWVSDGGDTYSLYWAGSFVAPDTVEEPYSWNSENDKSKTSVGLLASSDDSKIFTYSDGQISYSMSVMGTTTKVRLERGVWTDAMETQTQEEEAQGSDTITPPPSSVGSFSVKDTLQDDVAVEIVKPSDFNVDTVISQLDIEGYFYDSRFSNYAFLIIKNNSEYDLSITANVTFYDDSENLVGANSMTRDAVESGYNAIFPFTVDEEFARLDYDLEVEEEDYHKSLLSDLVYTATPAKDKIILSVTNNSNATEGFIDAHVLFFNGDDVAGYSRTTIATSGDIKPGKTINKEIPCYDDFDSYRVILYGYQYDW